jgi:hypothetical protein
MDTGPINRGSYPTRDKRFFSSLQPLGHEADRSSPSNAEVNNAWILVDYFSTKISKSQII